MPVKLKTDFEVPAGTHTVLVQTDHYWGRGSTKDEAMAKCKAAGGQPSKTGYLAFYFGEGVVPDSCWVRDPFGETCWDVTEEVRAKPRDQWPQPVVEDRVAPSYRA